MKITKILSALALMFVVASSCSKDETTKTITDSNTYESKMGIWQSHRMVAGSQTGTYTAECDIVTEKDSIDLFIGLFHIWSNVIG